MSNGQAMARLRRAITKVAANRLTIVREVFGDGAQNPLTPIGAVSSRPGKGSGWRQEKTLAQAAAGRPLPRGMLNCLDV